MAKIILLNIDIMSTRAVYRQLWVADAGDVVVSPIPIDQRFLGYVADVLGFDRDALTVLVTGRVVDDQTMVAEDLLIPLREATAGRPDWELMPAAYTEGVADLAERLGLRVDDGLRFSAQRGPELLNRKSHFRQLAVGAGLPVADGSVVTSAGELAKGIERHLPRTGTVIVKRDNDNGGRGNLALTTGEPIPLPGARETWPATGDTGKLAADVWTELIDERNSVLVVEVYHEATHCFYFEYLIGGDGKAVFLDSGSIRRSEDADPAAPALVWVGLELPAELPVSTAVRASTLSAQIVNLAAQIGYRGHINVDAIITDEGEFVFNEVNARWGGSLSLHSIGQRLLGPGYADTHIVSGLRDVPPLPLPELLDLLAEHNLHFDASIEEGVVIVGYDVNLERTVECVVIGPSRPRVREIEATLRKVVAEERRSVTP